MGMNDNYDDVSREGLIDMLEESTEEIQQLRTRLKVLQSPMPCGHLARYAVNTDDGTQYCVKCDRNAQMIALENIADVLNKTADCIHLLREVKERVGGLRYDYYDDNLTSIGERIESALIALDKVNQ
jgi:hypothetical protein